MMSLLQLEYSNERYEMLDSTHKGLKSELSALRDKEKKVSSMLTRHQVTVDRLTQELLAAREQNSRLEVSQRSLKVERDTLLKSERRLQQQYEDLLKEQRSQNVLLTNIQAIQNNLERSEYETKMRLTAQVEALEKEATLLKDRLHNEEEKKTRVREAFETQVREGGRVTNY